MDCGNCTLKVQRAAEAILAELDDLGRPGKRLVRADLPFELIIRGSTARPPA